MVRIKRRGCPVDYRLCNQTVTVYHRDGDKVTRTVHDKAFLDYKKTENVDKTGSKEDALQEALQKAAEFIDCGQKSDGKKHPCMVDWEQDAPLIIPAVNRVANMEVRAIPNLHWWTFFGWFMEIGDSTFSNVLYIRSQKAKGKKLDKATREWYEKNRRLVDLKVKTTDEEEDTLKLWVGGKSFS